MSKTPSHKRDRRRGIIVVFLMILSLRVRGFTSLLHRHSKRHFKTSTICYLNRFLFDISEATNNDLLETIPTVVLQKDDYRTIHAAKILGLKNGDKIRAGVVSCDGHKDGLWTDDATIEWIPEGKVKKAQVLKNGNPPGSLSVRLNNLAATHSPSDQIHVSLILALPRPLQLGRMLPMIAQLGVDQLILSSANKVPKDYFGSHLFREPDALHERLIEGLCQAGDVRLPKIQVVRNLRNFLSDDLDRLFPAEEYARVIAHPQRVNDGKESLRMSQVRFPDTCPPRIVVAVGPEGGWEEPTELDLFVKKYGFQQCTLGPRTLRSDCAVVSLLSLAHEACVANFES